MRSINARLVLCAVVLASLSGTAQAARWRVGVYVGPPYPYYPVPVAPVPYYYAPYPAYPPPVLVAPDDPDAYVERGQDTPSASPGTWWYCDASKAYYPYVKQCRGGWRAVPASPPPEQ
ncbi:hypothetical protein [Trinickia fusca]|uniref:Lipoprotein n=1 Tax=Trinickia fusca TaxID=2419777 RepID=A0A494XTC3_9BURK|nr:hypothetical protein [Trinickia fusca]RKP52156.1 hypothetical protein D7S89_00980 [Trinickia fusca]